MERKIGEIFEYNGEWYQCVEGLNCRSCCFYGMDCDEIICDSGSRKDDRNVAFKKLEKVGEPFSCNYYGDKRLIMMQEYRAYDNRIIPPNGIPMYVTDEKHKKVAIAIKQNQEDMEEIKIGDLVRVKGKDMAGYVSLIKDYSTHVCYFIDVGLPLKFPARREWIEPYKEKED